MTNLEIPKRLPVLLVTDGVLLPSASLSIQVKSKTNIAVVEAMLSLAGPQSVLAIAYRTKKTNNSNGQKQPKDLPSDFYPIGTAALVSQVVGTNWPRLSYSLHLTGLCRIRINCVSSESNSLFAFVTQLDRFPGKSVTASDIGSSVETFLNDFWRLVSLLSPQSAQARRIKLLAANAPLDVLVDLCVSLLNDCTYDELLTTVSTLEVGARVTLAHDFVRRTLERLDGSGTVNGPADCFKVEVFPPSQRSSLGGDELNDLMRKVLNSKIVSSNNRNHMTPHRPKSMSVQGGVKSELEMLEEKLKAVGLPETVKPQVMNEWEKFKNMNSHMPDYTVTRNWLELVASLPWSTETTDTLDVAKAKSDLEDDHHAMDDVKQRVLEYLAVRKLKNSLKGPILCFVGPPGVGKTSVARSIARTLGRKYQRLSLGGIGHEADIRGHRRTYIGSMPGRIVQAIQRAATRNPVILLDEIDKVGGSSFNGNPMAALLEVLDPEQNSTFTDHYLNLPFDLSQVLFIATANTASTIDPALLDRMERITIAGYTLEEKVQIAERHLLPKQLLEHGLRSDQMTIPLSTLSSIARYYTREAGVRTLERKLAAVCRAVALAVVESEKKTPSSNDATPGAQAPDVAAADSVSSNSKFAGRRITEFPILIDEVALEDILGVAPYTGADAERLCQSGVAAGLAWTPVGGVLMYVEASLVRGGKGRVTLTGKLGDVMRESVTVALHWLRARAAALGLPTGDPLSGIDVHVHFPEGAVSKDGPSAGLTCLTALVSLFTGRCARSDTAMTGEITLRGLLLPVGGIKDKALAAYRAGFGRVVLPKRNEKDVAEIPSAIKEKMQFIYAESMAEALTHMFEQDAGLPPLLSSKV